MTDLSLVSCITPTHNRRAFLARSIEQFQRQAYTNCELVIVDDGSESVADLIPTQASISHIRLSIRQSIGAKRNLACREARGDIILHWDDDDWYAPWRISYQVEQLLKSGADICGLDHLYYHDQANRRAWEYRYTNKGRPWVAGNTLCYRRSFWQAHPFAEIDIAEDSRFVWQAKPERVLRLEDSRFIVASIHQGNISPKVTTGCYWQQCAIDPVLKLMEPETQRAALVTASLGIGDILRVTPLVRLLHRRGYTVDMLIEPDYPDIARLLEPAPEIRRVYTRSRDGKGELPETQYDIATFTYWSRGLESRISANRKLAFDRNLWLQEGDTKSVERIARELGWTEPLPSPIAAASDRRFDLPPGTLAIHTGCKLDWPWKKWHGFDQLAGHFKHVALLGTPKDFDNSGTYFRREFRWPDHVLDFSGKLDLRDTAALIAQCGGLVSNDSGIMHLAGALGVPTFGIFGITSPQRELMALPNMIPITKGLSCEAACRTKAWGRRDCERHLECLKTLSPEEVAARIEVEISSKAVAVTHSEPRESDCKPRQEDGKMTKLGLVYHGHVFDASGYGNAARGYIHALHTAGVELSVVDLSGHVRQVKDDLVESLVGRPVYADFQLFHGIPHIWAQRAFRVSNAIAMTVWETDTMPTQWRNTLNHALETWLPCDFNIDAFQPHMRRPLAKIPHPIMKRESVPKTSPPELFKIAPDTFVVYSIFEWQDRKCPLEQLISYLHAFSARDDAILVLKTNPSAAAAADKALEEARRQTGSDARVMLCPEAWSEQQISLLHQRGDCYLSLHRGEGWCYPLFEAACAGTPVVATAYSGPLEYLDPAYHRLVPYRLAPVRQQYMYYHARMMWADPDIGAARDSLRWVYENRSEARAAAVLGAANIKDRYSLEAVGTLTRNRLMDILERTNRGRWEEIRGRDAQSQILPPVPIPGDWYDAAYFEHGIKSNWRNGYHWKDFAGLFRETAAFLTSMFGDARTYFDAGCAKGFLVRALRESGLEAWGCDISRWAIDRAEPLVKPYIECAAAESYNWDRDTDVLLAFHLLSQLTDEQAVAFLERARSHVKTALVAVIPLFENDDARRRDPGDAAHITRRDRTWWHERILSAGWRQDPLHKAMERVCQRHALPTRMGWELFVYSPGL